MKVKELLGNLQAAPPEARVMVLADGPESEVLGAGMGIARARPHKFSKRVFYIIVSAEAD